MAKSISHVNHGSGTVQLAEYSVKPELFSTCAVDALYCHVPFCFHKCHYCDFYSLVEPQRPEGDRQVPFTDRIIGELQAWTDAIPLRPTTIFCGGGTPTLLRPELWRQLLTALSQTRVTEKVREFTVEANPETVTPALLSLLVAGGVNRMSLGVQSFNPVHLKTLERWHEPTRVGQAVTMARKAGLTNLNIDLIFAIPGQTLSDLTDDLKRAVDLGPEHIACYNLTYEPHTAMTQRLKAGKVKAVPEMLEREMFELVIGQLGDAGFEQYEVSNFAQPGRRCEHNLLYWRNANWLGLGPAAASHLQGHRWRNLPHLGKYLTAPGTPGDSLPPIVDYEHLPEDAAVGEKLMMGLRLLEGVERSWLDAHVPATSARARTIQQYRQLGLLELTDTHLRLTGDGLFVADGLLAELL